MFYPNVGGGRSETYANYVAFPNLTLFRPFSLYLRHGFHSESEHLDRNRVNVTSRKLILKILPTFVTREGAFPHMGYKHIQLKLYKCCKQKLIF